MKRQYLVLILSTCFYLTVLGQEKSTNSFSVFNRNSIQELGDQFRKPANRVSQQHLITTDLYKEKLDSIIEYNYDEGTGTWNKKDTKVTYVYDENFNEVLWVYSAWNAGDNSWTNLMKEESQYDEIENSMVITQFIWSKDHWNKERKWEYSYNQHNELFQELSYQWKYNLDDWLLTEKWNYSYNAQGKPLTDSLYWWYANSQEWKLQEKVDYQYINDKELHYTFYSNWDADSSKWIESKKKWYLYDLQWRLITLSSYEWDNSFDDNWKLTNRKGYSYDDDDYLKKFANVVFKRKEDGSLQHEFLWEAYEFDFSFMFSDILLPNYLNQQELKFHHKLLKTSLSQYNSDTKQEEQYREVNYYYSSVVVTGAGSQDLLSENVSIYPNPAKESIYINYPGEHKQAVFELYDSSGKKIFSSSINKGEWIAIHTLEKGLYIYRVTYGQNSNTGKFIKE